jgi:hypothetical protein
VTVDLRRFSSAGSVLPGKEFYLRGANAAAFDSWEPELLLAGAAGTGKSLCLLSKAATICDKCPGARILICRKTRESLTESILVTWERDVLGPHHVVLQTRPTLRRVRQSYQWPNGSVVVVGGMDKPDKVLSSEWDYIYCPEVTDLDLVDWETLGGRLRAGACPFQQLAADCNPTTPHHWIYKRQAAGLTRMYTSLHEDNPRYYERATGEWTQAGLEYLARLDRMTGTRKARFRWGKWVSAEGVVYAYDPDLHDLPADFKADPKWPRIWSIDWGKRSPTVLQIWAVDDEFRMYLLREVFRCYQRADKLGKWVKAELSSGREPRPKLAVCDVDDEDRPLKFSEASGVHLSLADKSNRPKGIQETQARFDVEAAPRGEGPGRPRIFFTKGAREHEADELLVENGLPASTVEELAGYVWNDKLNKDEPIEENDHGMDAMRYACRAADSMMGGGPRGVRSDPRADPFGRLPGTTFRR